MLASPYLISTTSATSAALGIPVPITTTGVTITNGSANITFTNTSGYYITIGTVVFFSATVGTSGGQVVLNTPYYIVATTSTYIQVSATQYGQPITFNAGGTPNMSLYGTPNDTRIMGAHILANGSAVTLTMTGFANDVGNAASIVWTGSTTVDTFIVLDTIVLINSFAAITYTASVANKVWLYMRHT